MTTAPLQRPPRPIVEPLPATTRRPRTRLAELRVQSGVLQEELANVLGISAPSYSRIENASPDRPSSWPTVAYAQMLARYFHVDVSELWPFLILGPCGCGRASCTEHTFNGRYGCRNRRMGPAVLPCDGCGEPLDYRRPAHIGERNWHRECYETVGRKLRREGEELPCPVCGEAVYRKPSRLKLYDDAACCSAHWVQHRFRHRLSTMRNFFKHARGWGGEARQEWGGKAGGGEGPRPHALLHDQNRRLVVDAAVKALKCYRDEPDATRLDVIAKVTRALEGPDAVLNPDGSPRHSRDAVRRAAEKRTIRKLEKACEVPEIGRGMLRSEADRLSRDFGGKGSRARRKGSRAQQNAGNRASSF